MTMLKMCKTCTYYKDGLCQKDIKPSFCHIRTRRGVYNNIEDSNITFETPFKQVLKFKSETQKEHFIKIVSYRLQQLNAIEGKLFRYTDNLTKSFDLTNLVMLTYNKAYKEVTNGKLQDS